MIKIASHIILSLMLLVSTIGIAISKHYCNDNLISTAVYSNADACCASDKCCEHKTEFNQIDTDYSASPSIHIPESAHFILSLFSLTIMNLYDTENTWLSKFVFTEHPPPIANNQTLLAIKQIYLL
ncbi:MAG: hypothetical protein ACEPOW_06105 [Bacteroidales bacterium]